MAGFNIDRRGKESIMQGFELFSKGASNFSVWQGKNLKFQSCIDDEELFENNIEALRQAGSDSLFMVRFHKHPDKDGFVTDKTPYISSFNFKVTDKTETLGAIGNESVAYGNPVLGKLEQIIQNQTAIESRLTALEEAPEDDEEEETPQPTGLLGMVEQFANTPQGQQMITQVIGGIVNRFMPANNATIGNNNSFQQRQGIAGVESEDEKIEDAISRLSVIDENLPDDLQKLATVAETQPATFNMLLGMLRKM